MGDLSDYRLTRWLFLRTLGAVHLVAFVSLWVQIEGLVGSNGILPVREFLDRVWRDIGSAGYGRLPTLCWLSASDGFLQVLCAGGTALSLLLIGGVAPIAVLVALWAIYLSLAIAGQTFLGFQWDVLLLETTFTALFFAPWRLAPALPRAEPPAPRIGLWLVRLLLFKLMFLSGVTKLLSLDPTWWSLTALDFHYYTQPLPTWTSWYAQQLPEFFDRASVVAMFAIEIGAPFLIFLPRRPRLVGCAALALLQVLIAATGNYGFFNLLALVLCLSLLDDAHLGAVLPRRVRLRLLGGSNTDAAAPAATPRRTGAAVALALGAVFALLSGLSLVDEMVRTAPRGALGGPAGRGLDWSERYLLGWGRDLLRFTDPFRTINGYGLFRTMTTRRPEIVIEGSADGRTWLAYELPWKPGDVGRRPRFVAPHQPRLDWQMWFAALHPQTAGHWLRGLLLRILEGRPEVVAFFERNPFPDAPPRLMRLVSYRYEFTTPAERAQTGAWWRRERLGELTGPLSAADLAPGG